MIGNLLWKLSSLLSSGSKRLRRKNKLPDIGCILLEVLVFSEVWRLLRKSNVSSAACCGQTINWWPSGSFVLNVMVWLKESHLYFVGVWWNIDYWFIVYETNVPYFIVYPAVLLASLQRMFWFVLWSMFLIHV
jgi:hypothetical protein